MDEKCEHRGKIEKCCKRKCIEDIEDTSKRELSKFSKEQKKEYVKNNVKVKECETRRKNRKKERNVYKKYYVNNKEICKSAFLSVLGINGSFMQKRVCDVTAHEAKSSSVTSTVSSSRSSSASVATSDTAQAPVDMEYCFLGECYENKVNFPNKTATKKSDIGEVTQNTAEEFHRNGINVIQVTHPPHTLATGEQEIINLEKIHPESDDKIHRNNEHCDESVIPLSTSLKICKNLRELHLRNCFREGSSMATLAEGLANMAPTLQELDISHNEMGSSSSNVAEALRHHPQLKHLDLSYCYNIELASITRALVDMDLEVMSLAGNDARKSSKEIADLLKHQHGLRDLILADCKLGSRGVQLISEALGDSLQVLDLSGNHIGEKIATIQSLQSALNNQSNIRNLSLACCSLQPMGVQKIISAIEHSSSLEILTLQENHIGYAAGNLGKAVPNWPFLKEIWLRDSHLEPTGVENIIKSLSSLKNLQVVSLEGNPLTKSRDALTDMIKKNKGITGIWLRKCQLEPADVEKIANALKENTENPSLEELDLSNNKLRYEKSNATGCLVNALKLQTNLRELWISDSGLLQEDWDTVRLNLPHCDLDMDDLPVKQNKTYHLFK